MKRKLLLGTLPMISLVCIAQETSAPIVVENMMSYQVSPNGQWIRCNNGGSTIYNTGTNELINIGNIDLGTGNCISNNGTVVGSADGGIGKIYINGKDVVPESLSPYWFCYPCAITPEDTRITGTINNTSKGPMYVPFYCDLADDGSVGKVEVLPYPENDLMGTPVQYVSAVWISGDGKTILGDVSDNYGTYFYPIIFTQDDKGEWAYTLPTKEYFNPNNIELPKNPWIGAPKMPVPEDYMSPIARDKFNEEMAAASEGLAEYPDPVDFMTPEEIEEYNKAANEYNDWLKSLSSDIKQYEETYNKIILDSYQFPLNEFTLSYDGKSFATTAVKQKIVSEEVMEEVYYIFIYDIDKGEGRFVDSMDWVQPHQILSDGTILANYPLINTYSQLPPSSFVIEPGSSQLIPFEDYCKNNMPTVGSWIKDNLLEGTGVVSMALDKSVIVGSYDFFNLGDLDDPEVLTYSYIFADNAGVENILSTDDGSYKVYNLQGINILNTKEVSKIKELPTGIYIVNGKKYLINR